MHKKINTVHCTAFHSQPSDPQLFILALSVLKKVYGLDMVSDLLET